WWSRDDSGASCCRSILFESVRERVAQQYDVTEPVHLRQLRAAVWVPRVASIADEPLRPRVADEERRNDEVQLVGKTGSEELRQDLATPLDHQPPHTTSAQVLADPAHFDRPTAVDDRGDRPEPATSLRHGVGATVDQLLGVTCDEKGCARVQFSATGDGHLD